MTNPKFLARRIGNYKYDIVLESENIIYEWPVFNIYSHRFEDSEDVGRPECYSIQIHSVTYAVWGQARVL